MKREIIWFPKEPNTNYLELYISKEGILFFNDTALKALPEYINFGYNTETNQLCIKKSNANHGFFTRNFPKKIDQLNDFLMKQHIESPICYHLFQPNENKSLWVGTEYRNDRLSPLEWEVFQMVLNGSPETQIRKSLSLSAQHHDFIMEKIEAIYYKI